MLYTNANLLRLTLVMVALLAALIWFVAPPPPAPNVIKSHRNEWALPVLHREPAEKSVASLTANNLWGIIAAASEVALNPPEWRFAGITDNPRERNVLVAVAGKPVQFLKEGDLLPGGAKIASIHEDRLCILVNGKKRTLYIFQ